MFTLCCLPLLTPGVVADAGGCTSRQGMLVCLAGGSPAMEDLLGALGPNASQVSSSSPSNLADLLGTNPPTTSTSSAGAFADLLNQPVLSSSPQFEPITAYDKDGIRVVFRLSKPAGQDAITDIEALYSNATGQPITDFSLQVGLIALLSGYAEPSLDAALEGCCRKLF